MSSEMEYELYVDIAMFSLFLRLLLLVVKRGYLFQSTPIFVIIVREWRRCFGQTGTNVLQKEEHKKLLNKLNHLIAEESIEIKIKKMYTIYHVYTFCHAELVSLLVMDVKYYYDPNEILEFIFI
jgi:hypothetical protein